MAVAAVGDRIFEVERRGARTRGILSRRKKQKIKRDDAETPTGVERNGVAIKIVRSFTVFAEQKKKRPSSLISPSSPISPINLIITSRLLTPPQPGHLPESGMCEPVQKWGCGRG